MFSNATQCSEANERDFVNVNIKTQEYSIQRIMIEMWLGLLIHWIRMLMITRTGFKMKIVLIDNFIFPIPAELERMQYLQESIRQHYPKVSVYPVEAKTQTKHHCQFTGVGDLLIVIKHY